MVVRYLRDSIEIEVQDDGSGSSVTPGPSAGQGLLGMSERVGLYGGSLDVGPIHGGGFRVDARLPR